MRSPLSKLCALAAALLCWAHAAQQQPNIILFLVDDMGWEDTSVPVWRAQDGSPRPVFLNAR